MSRDLAIIEHGEAAVQALFHAAPYDPVKRREYYERTKDLKGRRKGRSEVTSPEYRPSTVSDGVRGPARKGASNKEARPSRRASLEAQKKELQEKLSRLQDILAEKVKAAKKRSGIEVNETKETTSSKSTKTESKKSKDSKESKSKPLTEKQKREKREASKEQYEKENRTTLAQEVETLQRQIKDVRAKIAKAVADARKSEPKQKTERKPDPKPRPKPAPQTAPKGR